MLCGLLGRTDGVKRLTEVVSAGQQQSSGANTENHSEKKNKCLLNGTALQIHRIAALLTAAQLFRIITTSILHYWIFCLLKEIKSCLPYISVQLRKVPRRSYRSAGKTK